MFERQAGTVSHDVAVAVGADADSRTPAARRAYSPGVLAVIASGGGIGTLARYGIAQLLPTAPGRFPWGTFMINVLGCLLIGVLMVLISEVWAAHPLLRPFLGVGVLGGFTTFSTYANELRGLLRPGSVPLAFAYFAATPLCALLATIGGIWLARAVCNRAVRR